MSAKEVVAAYWAAAEARDWERFGSLVAGDVLYEVPQTRERVRGRPAYVRFNADGFPGDWRALPAKLGDAVVIRGGVPDQAVREREDPFRYPQGQRQAAAAGAEVRVLQP